MPSSSTDSNDTLPEYVFPGTSSFDPFAVCEASEGECQQTPNSGRSG